MWEWAEHLHAALRDAARLHERAVACLDEANLVAEGWDGVGKAPSIDLCIMHIKGEIERNGGRILTLLEYPEAAVDGLRDQALQLGAARVKSGGSGKMVKTGAVDSASMRLVTLAAIGNLTAVVVVSMDKDVREHYARQVSAPTIVPDLWNLKRALPGLEESIESGLRELVEGRIREELERNPEVLHSSSLVGGRNVARDWLGDDYEGLLAIDIGLDGVRSVHAVEEVELDRGSISGTAIARGTVNIEITTQRWNDVADALQTDIDWTSETPAEFLVSFDRTDADFEVFVDQVIV